MTITLRKAPPVCLLHEVAEEEDDEDNEDGDDVLDLPPPDVTTRALRQAHRRRVPPESPVRLYLQPSRISYVRWFIFLVTGTWLCIRPSPNGGTLTGLRNRN